MSFTIRNCKVSFIGKQDRLVSFGFQWILRFFGDKLSYGINYYKVRFSRSIVSNMIRKQTSDSIDKDTMFSPEDIKIIHHSFTYRYKIQEALNKYDFKETISHAENISNLLEFLQKPIQIENQLLKRRFLKTFGQFLKSEENIPIEVNMKKLRYEQLASLLDEWQNSMKQPSLWRNPQRLYSIEHRNILFSRVFFEEKQRIEEYFVTLSEKKMLKGVDLYQLLGDILSPYYLYEYSCDNETFFEKINSFHNFLEVVDKFINSQTRIILDNKSKDFEFIKLYEFEALVYFWQSINSELELRSDKRFSNATKEVQTQRNQISMYRDAEVQTINLNQKTPDLQTTINSTIKQLNTLTEIENRPQILEIIQNLCEALRLQKISLSQFFKAQQQSEQFSLLEVTNQKSPHKRSPSNKHERVHSNYSQKEEIQLQKTERISMKVPQSPQKKKSSTSKRKNQESSKKDQLKLVLDKSNSQQNGFEANRRRSPTKSQTIQRKSPQKWRYTESQQDDKSQTSEKRANDYFIKNLHLSDISSSSGANENQDNIELKRIDTVDENQNSIFNLLGLIYHHYSEPTIGCMNIERLSRFFVDIGIIQERQSLYELKCLKKMQIKNPARIKQVEFFEIMGTIMKADEDLTFDVISEFVDMYVNVFTPNMNNNLLSVKINVRPEQTQNVRYSQNRSLKQPMSEIRTQSKSYAFTGKKQGYSPLCSHSFTQSKGTTNATNTTNTDTDHRRKRYAYCQDTPKFQHDTPFNRFTQTRNDLSKQRKHNHTQNFSKEQKPSLPLPNYHKGYLQMY